MGKCVDAGSQGSHWGVGKSREEPLRIGLDFRGISINL